MNPPGYLKKCTQKTKQDRNYKHAEAVALDQDQVMALLDTTGLMTTGGFPGHSHWPQLHPRDVYQGKELFDRWTYPESDTLQIRHPGLVTYRP